MAIARVQKNNDVLNPGAADILSVPITPAQHNLLVIGAQSFNAGPLTATDSQSNTYTLIASDLDSANSRGWGGMFYLKDIPAGITSVVVSGYAFGTGGLLVTEYSGVDRISPLDQSSAHNNGFLTAAFTSGTTGTTSTAGELVVGYVGSFNSTDGAFSGIGGGFTAYSTPGAVADGNYLGADILSAGIGTYTFTGTNSGTNTDNTAIVATFKPATADPGFVTQYMDSVVWF